MRFYKGFGLFLTLIILYSCASIPNQRLPTFEETSYRTLATAGYLYDAAMTSLGQLYDQGIIKNEDLAQIYQVGNLFWASYHTSVAALEVYTKTKAVSDQGKVIQALSSLNQHSGELTQLLITLNKKKENPL